MSIITLITDFGNKDHFVAKIKGEIYSNYDNAKIVDISNNVSPFNIMEAAYILENAYKSFPDKTVHIIDVDSENCLLYTSPSPRDAHESRMPSSA